MPQDFFKDVFYYISETLPLDQRDQLSEVLDDRGGHPVSVTDSQLTHFIAASLPLEEFVESPPEDIPIVTPFWVERSAILESPQDPEYYSADPAFLFSGIVAAATDLSKSDCELISAAVTALGGQWRTALTRDVTHLFALAPGSAKYETAMHYREKSGIRVLVPHWFDDTVRLGIRDLPTRNYEWPEPRVFQQRPEGRTREEDEEYEPPPERMVLYDTASLDNDEQRKVRPAARKVWKGMKLLLGLSLDLSEHQRKALSADIRRQGGEVVEFSSAKSKAHERAKEELAKLEEADIFVTRFRTGSAYAKAYQKKKTIGTLAWLWYVRATGTLTRPADQLLHYPIPDKPADGFDREIVTVTNYTGKDREYLKKLITLMGGEFTASMSAETNTIVIAAYLQGTKTDKATSWSIPIVNHTWVEDCFVQWRRLTPARDKYIVFPPGVDFSAVLAERGIGRITWEPGELEEMLRAAGDRGDRKEGNDGDGDVEMQEEGEGGKVTTPKKVRKKSKSASESPAKASKKRRVEEEEEGEEEEEAQVPQGTAQSAVEVEQAVAMGEEEGEGEGEVSLGAQMDVDADFSKALKGKVGGARKTRGEKMDVDEDEDDGEQDEDQAGPSKIPLTKKGPPSRKAAREKDAPAAEVPAKPRLVRRYTPRKMDDEPEEEEDAQAARDCVTTPSPMKRPARTYGSTKTKRTSLGGKEVRAKSPAATKKPQNARRRAALDDDDIEMAEEVEEEEEEELPPPKPKAKVKEAKKPVSTQGAKAKEKEKQKPAAKPKISELPSSESDSDSIDEEERSILTDLLPNRKGKTRASAATPSKAPAGRSPQRINSVAMRTVADAYGSPTTKVNGKVSPLKIGPPRKAAKSTAPRAPPNEEEEREPMPAPAPGGKAKKPARAASPAESGRSTPLPPAVKARTARKAAENAEAGPSRASMAMSTAEAGSPSKMQTLRTPSRRSAATKATKRLHDVIMPDVVSFQKEMKKGTVRGSHEQEQETAAAAAAKGKTPAKTPAKGKKRASIGSEGMLEDEEGEEEHMPERKKRKPNEVESAPDAKGKRKAGGRKSTTGESEEPDSLERPPGKKSGAMAAMSNGTTEGKNVRVMTTQLTLSEDVVRGLTKLGVKIVTKPAECTHLLVRSVVRTEKFLCAMAVAPHVLGEKWAIMSAANKKLLPEVDYVIEDESTEDKYNFVLADALKRAKKNAGKLFGGITFYVTSKVPVETKLLKNVVSANGGQVSTQTPTVRILAGHTNRFVISCPEDVSIWRPLAQHHKIYTQELLLTSALKQEVDWEEISYQVQGSF